MGHDVVSFDLKAKNLNARYSEFEPGLPESGQRILVLGVDLKTWTGLTDSLWDLGFTLKRLSSSLHELDQLKDIIVDGILWDLESSSLKGLAVVSQLRGRTPVLPVMVISSPSNKELLIKALENGAMDFIIKPIDHTELRNKCVRLFG
ncbi:response regulator [Nitrospira sp. MA-1]|nr:response regulator [Nitrospira sp. MA-1]